MCGDGNQPDRPFQDAFAEGHDALDGQTDDRGSALS